MKKTTVCQYTFFEREKKPALTNPETGLIFLTGCSKKKHHSFVVDIPFAKPTVSRKVWGETSAFVLKNRLK